jgi:hypothetical protein
MRACVGQALLGHLVGRDLGGFAEATDSGIDVQCHCDAGCGTDADPIGKVGAPVEPMTLTLADANQGTATPSVMDFVCDVDRDSHGALRIRLVPVANASSDYEVQIVHAGEAASDDAVPRSGAAIGAARIAARAASGETLASTLVRELAGEADPAICFGERHELELSEAGGVRGAHAVTRAPPPLPTPSVS